MWIARKPQTIKRNGEYVKVVTGDPIPEADTWPNRQVWVNQGFIKWVERDEAPPAAPLSVSSVLKNKIKEKIREVPKVETKKKKKSKKSNKKAGD